MLGLFVIFLPYIITNKPIAVTSRKLKPSETLYSTWLHLLWLQTSGLHSTATVTPADVAHLVMLTLTQASVIAI